MVGGSATERPMILPIALLNREIVDAGNPSPHESILVEFPILVAIGAEPMASVVMPLVGKADGDPLAVKSPKLFDETIIQLLIPLAGEKLNDGFSAGKEFNSVAPNAVGCISERNSFRVTAVPRVLSDPDFLGRGHGVEWRKRRSWIFSGAHIGKGGARTPEDMNRCWDVEALAV
jgi:hypothetical protein